MRLLYNDYTHNKQFYSVLFVFILLLLANILFIGNVLGILIVVPEYLLVFYSFIKKDIKGAIFLHFCFIMFSLSIQSVYSMFDSEQSTILYDYASLKLIGPIRVCYFINIFFCMYFIISGIKPRKDILLYRLFKYLFSISLLGVFIGICGFVFSSYYSIETFIGYIVYLFVALSSLYILLCIASPNFIRAAYYCSTIAIMAGLISSVFSYTLMGIRGQYSVYETILTADIVYFSPLLLIGLIEIKERSILYISIAILFFLQTIGISGKGIFALAFASICFVYLSFFSSKRGHNRNNLKIKVVVSLLIVAGLIYVIFNNGGISALTTSKFDSARSMFSGDIDSVASSPYIRIASLANIIYEGIMNPFYFFFGHGYGGYFEDKLDLFAGFDLTNGAWSDAVVATGRFTSGHDTMVTVPLFNGFVGLLVILKIVILYTKRLKYNYLNGAAFLWLLFVFYFNTNYAFIAPFILLGAEYRHET